MPRTPSSRSRTPSSTSSRIPKIGTEFELNDHRGVIVGIAHVASSGLFGVPTLYTTYNRALQYIPNTRFTISYLLVEPKTAADVACDQAAGRGSGISGAHEGRVHPKDLRLLQISDRHRHQHADHDGDQLHHRAVDFGPDLLHVRDRKSGEIRRAEGDRRQGARTHSHDPVSGGLRVADGLWHGRRPVRADHLAGAAASARLRRDHHLLRIWGSPSSWWSSSPRSPATSACARSQDRAVRYFQGMTMARTAIRGDGAQ